MYAGVCTVTTEPHRIVVCDAGPLIHLDELACLDLLTDFSKVLIPDGVWEEVARHRHGALTFPFLQRCPCPVLGEEIASLAALFTLHRGEQEALQLIRQLGHGLLLTDDISARLAAQALGMTAHGSIGILIRSIRRRQKTKAEVLELLKRLPRESTLYIRSSLLSDIIRQVERV